MPEDDFDIYGEDDGFSTKPVGVSALVTTDVVSLAYALEPKALEEYDDGVKVEDAEPAAESPVVGEKRQREEDEPEDQSNANSSVKEEGGSVPQQDSHPQNGAYNSQESHTATNGGSNSNFDSVYIGDLQWVSLDVYTMQ